MFNYEENGFRISKSNWNSKKDCKLFVIQLSFLMWLLTAFTIFFPAVLSFVVEFKRRRRIGWTKQSQYCSDFFLGHGLVLWAIDLITWWSTASSCTSPDPAPSFWVQFGRIPLASTAPPGFERIQRYLMQFLCSTPYIVMEVAFLLSTWWCWLKCCGTPVVGFTDSSSMI